MKHLSLCYLVLISVSLTASLRAAEEKVVFLRVLSPDVIAKKMIEGAVRNSLNGTPNVRIVDSPGRAVSGLWLLVEKMVHNRKNPEGYMIAIVHTNSSLPRFIQNTVGELAIKEEDKNKKLKKLSLEYLSDLIGDVPPVHHINVASLDQLTPSEVGVFAKQIVKNFMEREFPKKH